MMKPRCSFSPRASVLYFHVARGMLTTSPRIRSRSLSERYEISCLTEARDCGQPVSVSFGSMVAQIRSTLQILRSSHVAPSMVQGSPAFSVVQLAMPGASDPFPHTGSPHVVYHLSEPPPPVPPMAPPVPPMAPPVPPMAPPVPPM